MNATLFPKTDEAPFHSAKTVASKIEESFGSTATIDWNKANARLDDELSELQESGAPSPMVDGHRNLFGNVTHITIRDAGLEYELRFFVYPDSPIEIPASQESSSELLIQRICDCLDYDYGWGTSQ